MTPLRRFATAALVALALVSFGWTNTARSEVVTYTLTGGTISGLLNGTPFSSNFTITADADSSSFVSGTLSGGTPIQSQAAVSTMTLIGFAAPFQITTSNFGPFVIPDNGFINGQQVSLGGFGQFNHGISYFGASGPPSVNIINGGGAISGGLAVTSGAVWTTSAGFLEITTYTNPKSATFSSAAAVPEPSTYAMAIAGLACGGYSMWRRRKRA